MRKFDYYQPKTVEEAFDLMQEAKGARKYVAGGTDLIVRMKQRLVHPLALVSLRGVESLKFVRADLDGGMTLGAMTLLREIERDERVRQSYPALWQAVKSACQSTGQKCGHHWRQLGQFRAICGLRAAVVGAGRNRRAGRPCRSEGGPGRSLFHRPQDQLHE